MTFEPSPALVEMEDRAKRLQRNLGQASLFRPRLMQRTLNATVMASARRKAETEAWEARTDG